MQLNVLKSHFSNGYKERLEKQGYRTVGNHSAVKICQWTKNMIRCKGGCYKFKFYGIRSHQCMQMTTSMFCANRCAFCWRGEKAPVSNEWYGEVDEPSFIVSEAIKHHLKLLTGFKGSENASKLLTEQSSQVRHVALSLTGEPITYPLINEILNEFHKRRISTFLVTRGQFPEQVKKLKCTTQFYISLDSPDKESCKELQRPLFKDYYERLLASLDAMAEKRFRKTIRITVIKGLNDRGFENYKELIERGEPHFVEAKGYVHVGASKKFLSQKNMPTHRDVVCFARELEKHLKGYEVVDEHEPSCAVLLVRKSLEKRRYINFPRFFELAIKGEAKAEDYSEAKLCPNF